MPKRGGKKAVKEKLADIDLQRAAALIGWYLLQTGGKEGAAMKMWRKKFPGDELELFYAALDMAKDVRRQTLEFDAQVQEALQQAIEQNGGE